MAIKLKCGCGKVLSIKDDAAGRRVKCPGCQALLRVPKPKVEESTFGDEWDLGDATEQDFDDEPRQRTKSHGGRSLPTRGSSSRQTSAKAKGKGPQPSKRGLLIGLSAGGGVLVIALVAWMLWPENEGSNVAVSPSQNTASSPLAMGGESTTSADAASVNPGAQPNVLPANPDSPATNTTATKLEGDLGLLQGTWLVANVGVAPGQPDAAEIIAASKQLTLTVEGEILTMVTPGGAGISSIKLDSTKASKSIDLVPLDAGGRKSAFGIYSLTADSWTLCISFRGAARPTEMLPNKVLDHTVLTLKKGTLPTVGKSASPTSGSQFDTKAWLDAESKLKAMKVNASLVPWTKFTGIEGPTHFVALTLPETPGGTISLELWAIASSISHIAVRTSFATDALLRQLAQHPGLLGINVDTRSTVTPDGIVALKSCTQLQILIFHAPVSPEVCGACSLLNHLRLFGIGNPTVSKELVASIIQLSQIESLSLQNTGITDNDLLPIQKMTKLKTLLLDNAKVTDEGLKTLKNFTGLTRLGMMGLNVTPQAVAELEAALPNCKVQK